MFNPVVVTPLLAELPMLAPALFRLESAVVITGGRLIAHGITCFRAPLKSSFTSPGIDLLTMICVLGAPGKSAEAYSLQNIAIVIRAFLPKKAGSSLDVMLGIAVVLLLMPQQKSQGEMRRDARHAWRGIWDR